MKSQEQLQTRAPVEAFSVVSNLPWIGQHFLPTNQNWRPSHLEKELAQGGMTQQSASHCKDQKLTGERRCPPHPAHSAAGFWKVIATPNAGTDSVPQVTWRFGFSGEQGKCRKSTALPLHAWTEDGNLSLQEPQGAIRLMLLWSDCGSKLAAVSNSEPASKSAYTELASCARCFRQSKLTKGRRQQGIGDKQVQSSCTLCQI